MKFDRRRKNLLNIVAMTSMCIFSLFAVFSGAVAWFSSVQNYGSGADNMEVTVVSGMFKKMTIHQSVTYENQVFQFDQSPSATVSVDWNSGTSSIDFTDPDATQVQMGLHSLLQGEQSALMFLIELDDAYDFGSDNALSINASTESGMIGDGFTDNNGNGVFDEGDVWDYPLEASGNPLSNVITFFSNVHGGNLDEETGSYSPDMTTSTYNETATYSVSADLPTRGADESGTILKKGSFADIESDELGNLEVTDFRQEECFFKSSSESGVRFISIVLEYSDTAFDFIYNTFLGSDVLEQNEFIYFKCDWMLTI